MSGYIHQLIQGHIQAAEPGKRDAAPSNAETPSIEDLIDHEAILSCVKEADDRISLAQVRAGTSTIRDSMARVVIEEERAERI